QGVGPGFISRLALRREVGAGLLVALPVAGLDLRRPMSLVHPPAETCSRAARAILAFLTGLESGEPDHGAAQSPLGSPERARQSGPLIPRRYSDDVTPSRTASHRG